MNKKRGQKAPQKNEKPEDFNLWTEVTKSVTPLPAGHRNKSKLTQTPPISSPPSSKKTTSPVAPTSPAPTPTPPASSPPASQPPINLDKKQIRRVKRGRRIEARIDLHGDFADIARQRLQSFFIQCQAKNKRWVLVITGKGVRGEGVLRREVPLWLRGSDFAPYIVGFEEAGAGLGGSGALIVQLRKKA